jgi:NAD-dependent SIR2 family protein deacetylase
VEKVCNNAFIDHHIHPPLPKELGLASPEDLFDIETFRDDPRPFFKFAHSLYPGSIDATPSHHFLASLDRRRILLRIYTQNIDSLEQLSGVRPEKVIYAHGSLSSATCTRCRVAYSASDIASDVESGTVPICRRPRNKRAKSSVGNPEKEELATSAPTARYSMRLRASCAKSKSDDDYDHFMKQGLCCGVIKPDVTFFGEKIRDDVGRSLLEDSKLADALLVMGTSLSV